MKCTQQLTWVNGKLEAIECGCLACATEANRGFAGIGWALAITAISLAMGAYAVDFFKH